MSEKISIVYDEETVNRRIQEVGAQISRDYAGKTVHMIGILKGSLPFMCELAKRISVPVTEDFMSCSSYGSGTVSKGIVQIRKDLDQAVEGKDILIVEDIIDSGNTLAYLLKFLAGRKPASIRICTLLDKPSRRVHEEVEVDYCCFQIDDFFVVGYGLDYDQRYRNLPYIGKLSFE